MWRCLQYKRMKMSRLDLTEYQKSLRNGAVIESLRILKKLYMSIERSLSETTAQGARPIEMLKPESQLLKEKEQLVQLAIETKCKSVQEISQKMDFLNTVFEIQKRADELNSTDALVNSVWKDCRIHLYTFKNWDRKL